MIKKIKNIIKDYLYIYISIYLFILIYLNAAFIQYFLNVKGGIGIMFLVAFLFSITPTIGVICPKYIFKINIFKIKFILYLLSCSIIYVLFEPTLIEPTLNKFLLLQILTFMFYFFITSLYYFIPKFISFLFFSFLFFSFLNIGYLLVIDIFNFFTMNFEKSYFGYSIYGIIASMDHAIIFTLTVYLLHFFKKNIFLLLKEKYFLIILATIYINFIIFDVDIRWSFLDNRSLESSWFNLCLLFFFIIIFYIFMRRKINNFFQPIEQKINNLKNKYLEYRKKHAINK